MLELQPKQELLMDAHPDTVVTGGARGGGKSLGVAAKMALDVCECYTEAEAKALKLNLSEFRSTKNDPEFDGIYYYKYLIDYPDYLGVMVRRTESALLSNTKRECDKVFPGVGGVYTNKKYTFPSGAVILFRPCRRMEDLDWFQGQNIYRLAIEELTQFDQWEVDEMESGVRSPNPHIKAMKIYSTNPGKRGHKWVKEKFIDTCPALADGDPIYLPEYDLTYQPLKPNKPSISKSGEEYLFIPSLVFDNKYLSVNDKNYVRNMMSKNEILKRMWLFGDWDVFAGQFFSMWDENKHIIDELEFYGAHDQADLIIKRRDFDWSDWRLYLSNDYGFAERAAWACGAYAVHDDTNDIIKFSEIVESGLSIKQQARRTKEHFKNIYNLTIDDFEMVIADPKSYWQRQDKGEDFWTFAEAYREEDIFLTKGINDRQPGAMAMIEALYLREDGTPRMRFLSNCTEATSSIPNLPADKHNLNDVDTTVFDHPYDENRYFLMVLIGDSFLETKVNVKDDWRNTVREARKQSMLGVYEGMPKSWKSA